jgi:hypothetical protein
MYKLKRPCTSISNTYTKKKTSFYTQKGGPYKCPQCNRSYSRKDNLKRHIVHSCRSKIKSSDEEENLEDFLNASKLHNNDHFDPDLTQHTYSLDSDSEDCTQIAHKISHSAHSSSKLRRSTHKSSNKNICNYCKKIFSRKYTLDRHLANYCKVKQQHDNEKEEIFQKLIQQMEEQTKEIHQIKKENKQLKQQLNSIIPSGSTNINNTTNANTTNANTTNANTTNANTTNNTINNNQKIQNIQNNNIQNNIKLVAFGQEDLSYITDNICKQILNKGFRSVPVLIKYTHFNSNKPEQHNVYISNMRDSHAIIYDGKQWKLMDRTEAVDQLIHDGKYYLVEKFEELFEELDPVTIKKFNRFVNQSEDDDILNGLKRDIKYMLYNNKNITEKTKTMLCEKHNLFLESSECE